jgi:hypothetical protein
MAGAFNSQGPLRHSQFMKIDDVFFYDKTRPPPVAARADDMDYICTERDRHDLVAFAKVQSSQLGWAIMERNDMRLWPNDWVPGFSIKIPTRTSLESRRVV